MVFRRAHSHSTRTIRRGSVQIAYETILHLTSSLVFQLCGQDEADLDSQAPAGPSKGTPSLARIPT
jgi:hypothetical protein